MRKVFLFLEILYLLSFQNINAKDIDEVDPIPLSFYTDKYQRSVILSAQGVSPEWNMEIFQNKTIVLELPDKKKVEAEIYALQVDSLDQSTSYFGMTKNGFIQFSTYKMNVIDPLTGQKYGYRSEVHYHDTATSRYEYLQGFATRIPNIRLGSTWLLTSINDKDYLNKYQYQLFQRLSFNLETNTISGFAGCNQFQGKIFAEDEKIEIKSIDLIYRDQCQFDEYENYFLNILRNKTFHYSIKHNELILFDNQNKLIFKASN